MGLQLPKEHHSQIVPNQSANTFPPPYFSSHHPSLYIPLPYFQPLGSRDSEGVRRRKAGLGKNRKEADPPPVSKPEAGQDWGEWKALTLSEVMFWLVVLFTEREYIFVIENVRTFVTWGCLGRLRDLTWTLTPANFVALSAWDGVEGGWVSFRCHLPSHLGAEFSVWAREEGEGKGRCFFI